MGVADDLARSFAVEVVKVSDEKGAKALFNNIVKLQENTKYTPSLYTPVAGRGGEVSKNLQTIVPKVEDVSPLAQEAPRVINGVKYNNLEEFVKAQTSATQYGDYQPALRKYGAEGYTPITKLGVKPDEMVTVYRGIDDIKGNLPRKINNGDFVTTDFDSALSYTGSPKMS